MLKFLLCGGKIRKLNRAIPEGMFVYHGEDSPLSGAGAGVHAESARVGKLSGGGPMSLLNEADMHRAMLCCFVLKPRQ